MTLWNVTVVPDNGRAFAGGGSTLERALDDLAQTAARETQFHADTLMEIQRVQLDLAREAKKVIVA